VGVVLGWAQHKKMDAVGAETTVFRTEELLFRDLLKGRVDYAYLSYQSSGYRALTLGLSEQLRAVKLKETQLYLCFSRQWQGVETLLEQFNRGLAEVQSEGTYDRIHAKYR